MRLVSDKLEEPLRWRTPSRVFVNSMSDLFHPGVPDGFVMRCLNVMAQTPHTYQILTKRPERMHSFFARWADISTEDFAVHLARGPEETRKVHPSPRGQLFADMLESMGTPPPGAAYPTFDWAGGMIAWPAVFSNVWLGVSIEDQTTADERIPILLRTPAAVRFVSYEPALGPVDFGRFMCVTGRCPHCDHADEDHADYGRSVGCQAGVGTEENPICGCRRLRGEGVHEMGMSMAPHRLSWLIVGGESGPGARPCDVAWIRSAVEQCRAAGVPVFVKQLGARPLDSTEDAWERQLPRRPIYGPDGSDQTHDEPRLANRKGGDPEEWPEDLRIREFPR